LIDTTALPHYQQQQQQHPYGITALPTATATASIPSTFD
jgi:hypothetical protein